MPCRKSRAFSLQLDKMAVQGDDSKESPIGSEAQAHSRTWKGTGGTADAAYVKRMRLDTQTMLSLQLQLYTHQ
jgi:hypothetical protein